MSPTTELPYRRGLIMISKAYYAHFIERHVCDERFVAMARALGVEDAREPMDFIRALEALQRACGVADLRMSDYGISPDEFPAMVRNARETMGFLFPFDGSRFRTRSAKPFTGRRIGKGLVPDQASVGKCSPGFVERDDSHDRDIHE